MRSPVYREWRMHTYTGPIRSTVSRLPTAPPSALVPVCIRTCDKAWAACGVPSDAKVKLTSRDATGFDVAREFARMSRQSRRQSRPCCEEKSLDSHCGDILRLRSQFARSKVYPLHWSLMRGLIFQFFGNFLSNYPVEVRDFRRL